MNILKSILIFITIYSYSQLSAKNTSFGEITQLSGNISSMLNGDLKDLKKGDKVFPGQYLISADNSTAIIILNNGNQINLKENSKIRLLQPVISTKFKNGKLAPNNDQGIGILGGSLLLKVKKLKKEDGNIFIQTPTIVAAVRGTEFSVSTAKNGESLVNVDSGKVAVNKNFDDQELILNKKQSTQMQVDNQNLKKTISTEESKWLAKKEKVGVRMDFGNFFI